MSYVDVVSILIVIMDGMAGRAIEFRLHRHLATVALFLVHLFAINQ